MREILFRGKCVNNGEWVCGSLLSFAGGKKVILPSKSTLFMQHGTTTICCNESYDVTPTTVGQYAGLTDKNGVKIFEGDIVKLYYIDTHDSELSYEWLAVVEFGNPNGTYDWGFQLRPIASCAWDESILLWVDMEETGVYCEVIGNIFDNPELLEGNEVN